MTVQPAEAAEMADLARLRAAEAARVAASRERRRRGQVKGSRTARAAAVSLAVLPTVDLVTAAVRRAVLCADGSASGRHLAELILAELPTDPDAGRHRRELDAEVRAASAVVSAGDLAPWRTPAEDRWTDAELRDAANRWRKGARRPELRPPALAYRRILKRRTRGQRATLADDSFRAQNESPDESSVSIG